MVTNEELIKLKKEEIEKLRTEIRELIEDKTRDYVNKWVIVDDGILMFVDRVNERSIYGDRLYFASNDLEFEEDDFYLLSDRIKEISKEKALELATASIENFKEKILRKLKLNQ